MNIALSLSPGTSVMGDCFRCDRSGLQTIRAGVMTSPGGPGHVAGETPIFVCRACERALLARHMEAQTSPARPYVRPGLHHPH
ncbi:hypothetical protein [Streptomyces sp. NPDC059479]|uniref:hypothetical protein n=1 Tax=Streptomyces sp. NPDC059479 TaxID=3346848 RepID=UPI0036A79D97